MGTPSQKTKKADLKVVMIGVADVGKTCLIVRYVNDTFDAHNESTIGASFFLKQWGPYNVAIWDTAGEERFSGLSNFYCRDAGAAIMVYDATKRTSFDELRKRFLPIVPQDNCLKVIVAAKTDLITSDSDREVSRQEAREFCNEINGQMLDSQIPFFETSSKTGEGVSQVFEYIFEKCLSSLSDEYRIQPKNSIQLHQKEHETKSSSAGGRQRKPCCKTN